MAGFAKVTFDVGADDRGMKITVCFLGQPQVFLDGKEIQIPQKKQFAFLLYMLYYPHNRAAPLLPYKCEKAQMGWTFSTD